MKKYLVLFAVAAIAAIVMGCSQPAEGDKPADTATTAGAATAGAATAGAATAGATTGETKTTG